MLDSQDIELLQNMITLTINQTITEQFKQHFEENNKEWDSKLEDRFKLHFEENNRDWDSKLERILDKRFAQSENMLLDELDRLETRLTKRIDKLQKDVEGLNEFYRISLLEKGNYQLLEKRVDSLEGRMDTIEKTIA